MRAPGLREAVERLRGGAAIRVGLMKGEDAATMRGWIAACDEMLSLLAAHPEPPEPPEADRKAWEREVLEHFITHMPATRETPDFVAAVSGAMLHVRAPEADPTAGERRWAQGACTTYGCPGDPRYAAPGRQHIAGCRYPLAPAELDARDPLGIVTANPNPTCPHARFGRPHNWVTGAFYVDGRLITSDDYVMCAGCGQIEYDADAAPDGEVVPAEPDAGEACPAIHSTNPCTICEMPASIQSADDRAEQIAQELERRARVARSSKGAVPEDFERADLVRGNFDQQAWAFEQAARIAIRRGEGR